MNNHTELEALAVDVLEASKQAKDALGETLAQGVLDLLAENRQQLDTIVKQGQLLIDDHQEITRLKREVNEWCKTCNSVDVGPYPEVEEV